MWSLNLTEAALIVSGLVSVVVEGSARNSDAIQDSYMYLMRISRIAIGLSCSHGHASKR
jgi:hypothetical protein